MLHRIALSLTLLGLLALVASTVPSTPPAHADEGYSGNVLPEAPVERIIVRFAESDQIAPQSTEPEAVAAQLSALASADLEYVRPMADGAHVLELPAPLPPEEAARLTERLAADPAVAYAEPDLRLFPAIVPNDPRFAEELWNLWPVTDSNYGANFPDAWTITTGSPAVVTAVLDTGGLLNHEDLAGRTLPGNPGYDFISSSAMANDGDGRDPDPSDPGDWVSTEEATPYCRAAPSTWHGSHVAGIFGARGNNGKGIAGANWVSPILFVRVLGKCGGSLSDVADAMRWAVGLPTPGAPPNPNPARVLNLSLGATATCPMTLQEAINAVNAAGAIVVVAAGNTASLASSSTPANCIGVVAVAASTQTGDRASYSNYGSQVTIAAPGGAGSAKIVSTVNRGTTAPLPDGDAYVGNAGTSMAAPHVTGVISLMLSANPELDRERILEILRDTATPFPSGSGCLSRCGAGIVNAGAAVEEAARRIRTVSFADNPWIVSEQEVVTVTLKLNVASNREVTVPYTISGTAGLNDHTLREGQVTFAPGERQGTLTFRVLADTERDPGETITIALGAPSRAALAAPSTLTLVISDTTAPGRLVVDTRELDFGFRPLGGDGETLLVRVANVGGASLNLTRLTLDGRFERQGGTCPASLPITLAPGSVCTLQVTFVPDRLGVHTGSLVIVSDTDETFTVALRGKGGVTQVQLPLVRQ